MDDNPDEGQYWVEFVRARLDEEERDARAATPGPWVVGRDPPDDDIVFGSTGRPITHGEAEWTDVRHIARQDPPATLARVEALRELVDLIVTWDEGTPEQGQVMPGDVLSRITAIWRNHPDYRPEWAPA